jgi:hypothetical protein
MHKVGVFLVVLAVVLVFGYSDARACSMYNKRSDCEGTRNEFSWDMILQINCEVTNITIERRCGTTGDWTPLESEWETFSYSDGPPPSLQDYYYKVTVTCSCNGQVYHTFGPFDCATNESTDNVIIIVADDMGVDVTPSYGPDGSGLLPHTPNLAALATNGVLFSNAWAFPVCTPTRAAALTGRYPFRTQMLESIDCTSPNEGIDLESEWLIPKLVGESCSRSSAAIGKWHLNGSDASAPNEAGFSHYSGALCNFDEIDQSYTHWDRTVNGTTTLVESYATSVNVDDALDWIENREGEDASWFLWLAFNAPHAPLHRPPEELITTSLPEEGDCGTPKDGIQRECYVAMIEAMDTEIGRLLDELGDMPDEVLERTTIIFVGDNGTDGTVVEDPYDPNRDKGTLFQGGIHVPLIIGGPHVDTPGVSDALVSVTDLFATTLNVMWGANWHDYLTDRLPYDHVIDSVSLLPIVAGSETDVRDFVYSEYKNPPQHIQTIRNLDRGNSKSYKLIRFALGFPELYELIGDEPEDDPLWPPTGDAIDSYELLCAALNALEAEDDLNCNLDRPAPRLEGVVGRGGAEKPTPTMICAPNPASGDLEIRLADIVDTRGSQVSIGVYDVHGALVREIWTGSKADAGPRFSWDGRNTENERVAGVYFVRLRIDDRVVASQTVTRVE